MKGAGDVREHVGTALPWSQVSERRSGSGSCPIACISASRSAFLNRLRDRDPETAAEAVRNVRQLVAVVVVLARATSAVLDTLQSARQPMGGVRSLRYAA